MVGFLSCVEVGDLCIDVYAYAVCLLKPICLKVIVN